MSAMATESQSPDKPQATRKPRVAVFFDHDIIIRHFVLNRALEPLEKHFDVTYLFPEENRRVKMDWRRLGLRNAKTVPVSEERAYLYRRLNHSTVLNRLRTTPDKKMAFEFYKDALGARAFYKALFFSLPGILPLYKAYRLYQIGRFEPFENVLNTIKPDIILHPSVLEGLFVSDLIRWGKDHKVPVVFIMNSWDNPAAKAMLVGNPDRLVVWGEHSRQLATTYLRVPPERVLAIGAAQFDLYNRPPKESVASYRQRAGLPLDKRVLLYAGSSKGLNETKHLETLDAAIADGRLANCAVLYRPHPWRAYPEKEKDFYEMNFKNVHMAPEMAENYKKGRTSTRMQVELADYTDTHVTLEAVDAVISPLSTILLESTMHGKPIAAYLPDEDMQQNKWLFTTSNMVHFRDFFKRVDCLRCERSDSLVDDCAKLLAKTEDPATAERLKAQCDFFVMPSSIPYGERLTEALTKLIS